MAGIEPENRARVANEICDVTASRVCDRRDFDSKAIARSGYIYSDMVYSPYVLECVLSCHNQKRTYIKMFSTKSSLS